GSRRRGVRRSPWRVARSTPSPWSRTPVATTRATGARENGASLGSEQDGWEIRAGGFVVEADGHQRALLHDPRAVVTEPPRSTMHAVPAVIASRSSQARSWPWTR